MADTVDTPAEQAEALAKPLPPGSFEGESITRRRAFEVISQAIGGVAAAGVMLPVLGFAAAPIFRKEEERWEPVGRTGEFSKDTYLGRVLSLVEGVGEAGKTTVYVREGDPQTFKAETAGEYVAISTRCAHLGCPVRFVEAAANFICPCHGGVYDFEGKVIGGPPVRPLDRFQTRVRNGQVEIGPRFSVTSQLDPVRYRDPGEFTGGIWNVLYPPRPSTPAAP